MTPIPDATRKRILIMSMHDITAAEVAAAVGVGRSTVENITNRLRGSHENAHRGNATLLYDPLNIFTAGARFNGPDIESWIKVGGLAEGTVFEFLRRTGKRDCMVLRDGVMIDKFKEVTQC